MKRPLRRCPPHAGMLKSSGPLETVICAVPPSMALSTSSLTREALRSSASPAGVLSDDAGWQYLDVQLALGLAARCGQRNVTRSGSADWRVGAHVTGGDGNSSGGAHDRAGGCSVAIRDIWRW